MSPVLGDWEYEALDDDSVNDCPYDPGWNELLIVVLKSLLTGMLFRSLPLDLNDDDKLEAGAGLVGVDFLKNLFKLAIELCLEGAGNAFELIDSFDEIDDGELNTTELL